MGAPALRWLIQMSVRAGLGIDWITVPHGDGTSVMIWDGDYELRKLTVAWSRTPTVGVVQDRDQCTFHFVNLTDGDPDATWTDADFVTVENAMDAFWSGIKEHFAPELSLSEYAWRKDGPAFRPFGDALSPTVRIVPRTTPGIAVGGRPLPPQCAVSVTEVTAASFIVHGVGVPGQAAGTGRTQMRNRWGRFYLPAPMSEETTDGRYTVAFLSDVANGVKECYDACANADIVPVMYSPTTGSSWSIDSIHIDDIVDVVRSRRYVTPITRTPRSIVAP